MSLGEEVLDEVRVSREEQVMQFVHAHADRRVDEQPPAKVSAERFHLTCRAKEKFVLMFLQSICLHHGGLLCS